MDLKVKIKHVDDTGRLHRLDGPAIIYSNGYEGWCVNGNYHRHDGPARTWVDGSQEWYLNGLLHRLDGPARVWTISKDWCVDGKFVSEQDFSFAVISFLLGVDKKTAELIEQEMKL